jgi:hypothetical protein
MRARGVVVALATVTAAIASACGTNFGAGDQGDGGPADGDDDNPGITNGDGTVDGRADGRADGTVDSPGDGNPAEGSVGDAPVDVGNIDGCSAQMPDYAHGVFVSLGGQPSACGSPSVPCTSIQTAITLAAANGKAWVYVDSGTYVEQLTLPGAGITVQGGWTDLGGNWSRQCASNRASSVVVQAPNADSATVLASYTGSASLDTLTIQSKPQNAVAAGETIYGVFATGASTTLTLGDVDVNVVQGGDGTTGPGGGQGQAGATTGCNPPATGSMGGNGTPGPGGTTSYDLQGFHRGDGQAGGSGIDGGNGTAATNPPSCVNQCSTCNCDVPCEGGVMPYCCDTVNKQVCGAAGLAGCGGKGGGGGQGGVGGGASIGVLAWDATVTIDTGNYTTGNGGTGGNGGAGAGGGAGASAPGFTTQMVMFTGCHDVMNNCIFLNGDVISGSGGGMGGSGGAGSGGGGGAGGDSYCYYSGGAAKVNASGWSCMPGLAGKGGNQGGSNQGANGNAGMHN